MSAPLNYNTPEMHNLNPNITSWRAPRGQGMISRLDPRKHSVSVMAFMDDDYPTTRQVRLDEGGEWSKADVLVVG